jgi:hypothetical protein
MVLYARGVMKKTYEELLAMTDDELGARTLSLNSDWTRLDRKSDPNGIYTARQRMIEEEQEQIEQILRSRRSE